MPRAAWVAIAVLILVVGLVEAATIFRLSEAGVDLQLYVGATRSWLDGDGFYQARQLAGPYDPVHPNAILYPPTLLWLLVPFTVLPAVLWWVVPGALVCVALWRLRPPAWTWPVLAFAVAAPQSVGLMLHGNPVIWVVALTLAGVAFGWGGSFVLLKPSLLPFALIGAGDRRWAYVVVLLVLLTLPLWAEVGRYGAALVNARISPLYSLGDMPLMLGIVAVWWAVRERRQQRGRTTALSAPVAFGE